MRLTRGPIGYCLLLAQLGHSGGLSEFPLPTEALGAQLLMEAMRA